MLLTNPDKPLNFKNDPAITNANQIGLNWESNPIDGGAEVLYYTLMWKQPGGIFDVYEMFIYDTSYVVQGVSRGFTYEFKISGTNVYGPSVYTDAISIMAAQSPSKPAAPTTVQNAENIIINWVAPQSGGSPITSYRLLIMKQDGTFEEDKTNCDGSTAAVIANLQCTIATDSLNSFPFNIAYGDFVFTKVIALNYYGESPSSDVSAGTKIITKPDPPRNFKENSAKRTKNALEFSWEHGASDGGAPVIDFRIYQNQDGSEYELIRSGVQDMFLYINTLSPGVYYGFKLQSRNIFGLGDLSDEFVILCATFPDTPQAPVTIGIEAEVEI